MIKVLDLRRETNHWEIRKLGQVIKSISNTRPQKIKTKYKDKIHPREFKFKQI